MAEPGISTPVATTPAGPAPVATEPAATPAAAPTPEAKPARKRILKGERRVTPDVLERMQAAMHAEKAAGEKPEPETPAEADTTDEPTVPDNGKPEPAKEEPKKEPEKPAPTGGEMDQLKALAGKLGLVLEDGRVTSRERAELRIARKNAADELAKRQQAAIAEIQAAKQELAADAAKVEAFKTALEGSDHDEIAKVAGFESWDKMVEDRISRLADPNYQRLKKLEQEAAERAKRDEQLAKEAQQRQEQQAKAQARANYLANLGKGMRESKDPLVAAFAADPMFVNAIFRIQEENYDGSGVPAPEQAVKMKLRGSGESPREYIERVYRTAKGILEQPPPAPATPPVVAKPAPKTPTVPKPKPAGRMDTPRAWKDDAIRRFEDAARADLAEERRRLGT